VSQRDHEQAIKACADCCVLPFSAVVAKTPELIMWLSTHGFALMTEHAAFVRPCSAHRTQEAKSA
jgi:hypothetical protein